MTLVNPSCDASTAPHVYTTCCDDSTQTLTRFLDGAVIYVDAWQWDASLGGAGNGPDACTIVNLAVGGSWPGNVANRNGFSADFNLYAIEYHGP